MIWSEYRDEYENIQKNGALEISVKQFIADNIEHFVGTKSQIAAREIELEEEAKNHNKQIRKQKDDKRAAIVEEWQTRCKDEYFFGYPKELFWLCHGVAYETGHAYGFNEVEIHISEMSERFKQAFDLGKADQIKKL